MKLLFPKKISGDELMGLTWNSSFAISLKVIFLTSIILLDIRIPLLSQNPEFNNYSIREGLPSTEVYEISQDSKGFIWFVTDHGVAKFDGYEMRTFTVNDGLTDPVVFGISEDQQQRIWFRTYSGKLSILENGVIKPYQWNDLLSELVQNNLMYCLHPNNDELYFSTERYIGKINSDGKIEKEPIKNNELSVRVTEDKKLLYGFHGSSRFIRNIKLNDQYYPIVPSDTINHNKVISGLQDGHKTIITLNSDVFLFNGTTLKKVFTGRSSIISFSKDKEGFYWVGYNNQGTDKLDPEDFTVVSQPSLFSDKSITKVLQDHEGGMWFSTLEEGVFYTPNLKTTTISLKDKSRFATFNSKYAVIGDQKGNVSVYEITSETLVWKKNFESPIRSLFIDSKYQLWISHQYTTVVSLETGVVKDTINVSYSSLGIESDSTVLGVGGLRISRFNLNGNSNYIFSSSIHLKLLSDNSRIYISGRTGLEIFDAQMKLIQKPEALVDSKITSIISFDDEQVFIGTIGNGFQLLNKKDFRVTSFNSENNFIANDVYFAQIKDSLLWISTEKGLLALKHQALKNNRIQFSKSISDEFAYEKIKFFHVTENSIWAVTDNSVKIIPTNSAHNEVNPIFYYELIRPHPTSVNQILEIDNKNSLQLKFGFISFNNQNIYARYRIAEEAEWTETSSRIINLQSISPGNYSLDIQFSLDKENWKTGTSLPFKVKPLWWNTLLFRILLGLFLLLTGFIIYRKRIARYQERNEYLRLKNEQQKKLLEAEIEATERERSRIAQDLHDSIGMDLVSMKLMTNQLAKKTDDNAALEIQNQLQKTISEIQNIIYGLTPSGLKLFGLSHGLDNYLSMVRRNHDTIINLNYDGDEVKDQQLGAMVFRIIQELVTNSIKHSQCTTITITITVSSFIQITYHDNGKGFNVDHVKPGLGLSNIRSRVESLAGQLTVASGSTGTDYIIKLPLFK